MAAVKPSIIAAGRHVWQALLQRAQGVVPARPVTITIRASHRTDEARPDPMKLLLAPMEGLADDLLRDLLTSVGGYDWAVSEFARVTETLLPDRFFTRRCPELLRGARTPSGTPLWVQLLGSDPQRMAANAMRLARLAPAGIDLNFGCPAPTVNRHRGGAVLLDEPELIHAIAAAVRKVVPTTLRCSAKMRLGVADKVRAVECAQALADAGMDLLVVHARTKLEGYRPPAHWEWVGRIADAVRIPVVANGEVWTVDDWMRCRSESGVSDVMLGRGAVADPFLARRIRDGEAGHPDPRWPELADLIGRFWHRVQSRVASRHAPGRLKQWLGLLSRCHPRAEELSRRIRQIGDPTRIGRELRGAGIACERYAA